MNINYTTLTIEQFDAINDPTERLKAWNAVSAEAARLKALEMHMRTAAVAAYFPTAGAGTSNFDLGGGYTLKVVKKENYKLAKDEQLDPVILKIEKLGEKGKLIAERLLKWKAEISVTEYKALSNTDKVESDIKKLIDSVLTITPGAPELEIVAPKTK